MASVVCVVYVGIELRGEKERMVFIRWSVPVKRPE